VARFVLLASPLLSPASWGSVEMELGLLGHSAEAPPWPKLSSIRDGYYEGLAEGLASSLAPGEPPILVAHSGAGGLVAVLAAHVPIAGVVFVDALLPHPGKSWFDTAPPELAAQLREGATHGELPSWPEWWPPGALERLIPDAAQREALTADLEPIPAAYFEEPAPRTELSAPAAYIRLSGSYEEDASEAERRGWPVMRLPLHHLAPVTHGSTVTAALHSAAEKLRGAPPQGELSRSD
jgi:hypothetical protein